MSCEGNIGESGLRFFGKISASISHEIKNTMAIINEKAGLLEDYTLMAEKGAPLDPERIKRVAENILNQIQRANGIIKNMNAFSHSIDKPLKETDFCELVDLVAALSGRFAAMRNITLEVRHPEKPIIISTNPFFLEMLVYLCLDISLNATEKGKNISLVTEKIENGARVRFANLDNLAEFSNQFGTEAEKALLDRLNAEFTANAGEIILEVRSSQ